MLQFNKYQTPLTDELLESLPKEVQDQLLDILNNVEFVRRLVSPNRQYAKDRPRDEKGRIIVDLANPHIIENINYFRPTAIHYQKYGCFTNLRPNANPNSEYGKWIREERRRCWEGYVRESDGEWVTGYMYWFLNYSPIMLSKIIKGTKRANRIEDFPEFWEGIYWRFHYMEQAANGGLYNNFEGGEHCAELASRGKGKSFSLASILSHDFILGVNREAHRRIMSVVTAYQKEFLTKDGVLNKFSSMINFCAEHTQFPRKRLKSSMQEMTWIMGYKDVELDVERGTLNNILGVSSKDDESKLRGKRAAHILIEEFGCHIKGTKVLMYDGSIKNVENITVGDVLMGDDNTPRVVQELYNGTDQLYKITLSNGDYQIVNSHHPVYFRKYNWNKGIYTEHTLTAPELLEIKNLNKGYYIPKAIIHFPYIPVTINPYFLGLWLGDGDSTRLDIANEDTEVLDWLLDNYEGTIRDLNQSDSCKVFHISKSTHIYNRFFSEYNLYNNKHIPQDYKINAPEVQLQVIAGLIDTDGTYNSKKNFFEITQRYDRKHILDDIKFMCECNGLKCSLSSRISTGKKKGILHYRLRISGNLSIIPTKINRKKGVKSTSYKSKKYWNDYTFKVEPYKVDEYYGFTVDKNHLFVLGDLTVTHNTFPRLTDMYNVLTPSVEEGDIVFGQIYMLGCVCAGTKVWTLDGRNINIEDLKKEDGIIGYSKLPVIKDNYVIYNNGITRESIGKIIEPVEKDCVKITLSNGNTLMCSTDHPIFVQTKSSRRLGSYKDSNRRKTIFSESFVKANQLKVGDRVCECRKIDVFGNNTLFDSRLVGMLIGDGSYGNNETPKYSSEDRELLEYVKGKYDTSLSATHITKKGNVYEDIRVKGICSYLKEIGIYGQVKQAKRLPSNYQTLTRNATIDLLSGLYDTDGTFYSKGTKSYIGLTQCNIEILKEVQILWRKFGVICSIRKTNPRLSPNRKDKNPWFTLIINGADNLKLASRVLSPLVTHKNKSNQEILSFFDTYVPKKIKGYDKDYLVYKVVSIEDIGKQVVYNLSACTSRTYLANNIITHNTAGDNESDFAGAQEIMYNPKGYRMYALPNVFDKNNQGRPNFVFFFPGYVNRKGCYNKDGVSDVVKALIEILMNRYTKKYNSSDPNTIIKVIAEVPITPAEAIVKTGVNMFPVTDLTERLGQLDNNPREFDDVYTGELIIAKNGNIEFKPSFKQPIREFPHKDNKLEGALEMFVLPEIDKSTGKPYSNRYIAGCLKEGEYVNTNSGFKKVEEVTLDDKLINIDGQEVKIHNLQRYYNKDKVYRVKLSSIIDSTVFSQEHPIYSCTPKKKYNSYTKVKKLGVPERYYEYNFDFKKVSELKVGDYVKSPILYTKEIVPSLYNDPDIWYLFGVLVGDGRASSNGYNINIAFNRAEKELIERCKWIVENKIGRKFTFVKDNGNCIEYSFCHKELNEYFSKYFGREAFNKHIDFSLKTIPYILRKNFILGYIDTDGSITGQSINIVSTSKTLLCDIQDWLFSLGIVSSVKVLRLESACTIEDRECQCKKAYQLNIGTEGLNAIKNWNIYGMKVSHYNVISITNHNRREVFIKDGYIYLKVKKIIKEDYIGYVYNFECDTHTFMCNYIPTHNCDPYDDDTSNTMSLGSIFILDLFTDKIVAEYTGRPLFADDFYEICRRMCLYYNARMNYENNKKGLFTYFSKRNCVYLLTDQLESLSDKQLIKEGSYGNKAKGTNATEAINNYGRERLRSWLLAPITTIQEVDGEPTEVSIPALFTLRSRALIKELINYNQQGNFDRISAMGMLMLLREDRIVQYQGNISKERQEQAKSNYLGNDDFFNRNYKKRQ